MRIVNIPYHVQSNQEMPDVMPSMDFKRVWQSASTAGARGARDTRVLSIWRPVGPPGYSSMGDVAVAGSEPPSGKPVKMYKDVMGAGDVPGQVGSSQHMGEGLREQNRYLRTLKEVSGRYRTALNTAWPRPRPCLGCLSHGYRFAVGACVIA
jgi:hypothetical protein